MGPAPKYEKHIKQKERGDMYCLSLVQEKLGKVLQTNCKRIKGSKTREATITERKLQKKIE